MNPVARFLPHWRVWSVHCGASTTACRIQWSAHPHPQLACGTQQELVAAISAAAGSNPTLSLLTRAAGPPSVPRELFAPVPPRPAFALLDEERRKLTVLHPAWHVWYGIRQLGHSHLRITWHARPEPTITGADSPADLGARIDEVMSDAWLKVREACREPGQGP